MSPLPLPRPPRGPSPLSALAALVAASLVAGIAVAQQAPAVDATPSAAPAPAPASDAATATTLGTAMGTARVGVDAAALQAGITRLQASAPASATRKTHELRLRQHASEPAPKHEPLPGWVRWLRRFGQWLANTSRVLVWALGIAAVALLLVGSRHLWQLRRASRLVRGAGGAISHVRDLDVRPESLPDDIGGSARALWLRGEHAAALSLLYRGALSRLIHRHAVPIEAASTEGECLQLAAGHAPEAALAWFAGLVRAWQRCIYGGQLPGADAALALCDGFAAAFDRAAPAGGTAAAPGTGARA